MTKKKVSVCDECSKEDKLNDVWENPNSWLNVVIKINSKKVVNHDFCKLDCLKKYLDRHGF